MERWARLLRVVRSLIGRGPVDRRLDVEVTGYLEMLADEKVAAGMAPDEALRRARIELGGVDQVTELVRAQRPAAWLDTAARDLRAGIRQLSKTPAFSVTAVTVLALGIGANVAVFGLVNLLLLQPRTGSDRPGEPVSLHVHDPKAPDSYRRFSYAEYEEIRRRATAFDHVAAHRNVRVVVSDGDVSRRATASEIGGAYFEALGVRLSAGRGFTPDEERPGSGATVAVINHETSQALGGAAAVLGRTIRINSHPFTVVGIAPQGFSGTLVAFGPLLWIPLGADGMVVDDAAPPSAGPVALPAERSVFIVARLKRGLTVTGANAALSTLSPSPGRRLPADAREVVTANPLARTEDGDAPGDDSGLFAPLGALAGMAALLLLVASLNVANMQLARGANRRKEIATRLALGAGRGRIVFQLLVEGLLLSTAGGIGGLLVGVWTLKLVAVSFTPLVDETLTVSVAPDIRVMMATAAYCVLSAAVFAIGPSWKLSGLDALAHLKAPRGDAGGSDHGGRSGPRNLVVAWQLALSLALLATAGLFVRGAVAAAHADPGYPLEGQVLLRADAPGCAGPQGREAFRALVERVRATPGVASASAASLVAFGNNHSARRVRAAGAAVDVPATLAQDYAVGAGYFRTLGLPLLRGREFTVSEELDATLAPAAIIDEPLARALFAGHDPIGQRIEFPASRARAAVTLEVIGLVAGQRDRLTDRAPVPHVYQAVGSQYAPRTNIHVRLARTTGDPASVMLARLRDAVRASDPRLALLGLGTLEDARDNSPMNWLVRAAGVTFGALGAIALGMAVAGLYGVKAYLVARRTREIGIRMALGASPHGVIALVVKDGGPLMAVGVFVGFLLALGAGHLVSSLLVGVRSLDPLVFVLSTAILIVAVWAASYLPARRATRIDPALALRSE